MEMRCAHSNSAYCSQLVLSLIVHMLLLQDWTKEEIAEVYKMPMLELLYRAATTHRYCTNVCLTCIYASGNYMH
jgi:hypothetical protein